MKIKQTTLGLIIIIVFFGTVLTSSAMGLWNTKYVKFESNTFESTNTVKGKTTFDEVLSLGVKKQDLEDILKLDIPNTSIAIRDFCTQNGIEFSTVKSDIQKLIDKK